MSYTRNILSNAGATAIGSAVQLILMLGLVRWLSVPDFAVFVTATAIVGFGEMASDFGVRIWSTRQFATRASSEGILGPALLSKAIFSVLSVLVILLLPFQHMTPPQVLLAALIACTQPSTDPLLWYLRGKERLDIEAAITLSWRIGNAITVGLGAMLNGDVTLLLGLWLFSNIVRGFFEWRKSHMLDLTNAPLFDGAGIGSQVLSVIRLSFPLGVAFLVMAIYQRMGVLILGEISTPETVAFFGVAFTLVTSAGFVATSITVSSFPRLVRTVKGKDWERLGEITNQKLVLVMAVFFPTCFLGMFVAPWVIRTLYPETYSTSAIAMIALLPGLYISTINFALKYLMNVLNYNWMDVISVCIGMLVFTFSLIGFKEQNLLLTAGIAWGIGETAIFAIKWAVLRSDKRTRRVKLSRHLFIYLLLLLVMFFLRKVENG